MSSLARCVVVSSGTLSPLNTFSSELGTDFPVRLEASHVIKQEQVFEMATTGINRNWTTGILAVPLSIRFGLVPLGRVPVE